MPRDKDARKLRVVRHRRLRRRVAGSSQRPRLSVFRSLNHIYAQVIDDAEGRTLVSACSLESEIGPSAAHGAKTDVSKLVGSAIAQRALNAGITTVVFDRGGFKYHGRVKILAEAAREGGLVF